MDYLKKINDLIIKKKMTKRDFSQIIEKNENTVQNYLTGKTKIEVETLLKIAAVLEVPISYFFEESSMPGLVVQKNLNNSIVGNNITNSNIMNDNVLLKEKILNLEKQIESLNHQLAKCEANNDFFKKLLEKKE